MSQIPDILRAEIEAHGAISFARFMEVALYCPKFGYYEREPGVIGSAGDFYTSASLGPAFGQLLAGQFAEWSEQIEGLLCWIECGAHDGKLALAILEWLGKNRPTLLSRLTYLMVEPSPTRREWQKQTLHRFRDHVRWAESFEWHKPTVIFSNEVADALPVHRVAWDAKAQEWFECGVSWTKDRFEWVRLGLATIDIEKELCSAGFEIPRELRDVLPDGFILEVAPSAAKWWHEAAQSVGSGKLIAIDYGGTAEELLRPERVGGTLRAFFQHHAVADILARPGEQDITAHVNFTQLMLAGERAGLKTESFVSQEIFLSKILQRIVSHPETAANLSAEELRAFQRLAHPEHLGHSFRVLVQSLV